MTIDSKCAPLDMVIEWEGLGTVTVREVVQHYHGGAYKAAFIRRAIAEGGARSHADLARWEMQMIRRGKEASRRGKRHPRCDFQITKKQHKPWPL